MVTGDIGIYRGVNLGTYNYRAKIIYLHCKMYDSY